MQYIGKNLPPRLLHVSETPPSSPEGLSVVHEDLDPCLDLLGRLEHHMELSRAIHANEDCHKELGGGEALPRERLTLGVLEQVGAGVAIKRLEDDLEELQGEDPCFGPCFGQPAGSTTIICHQQHELEAHHCYRGIDLDQSSVLPV